MPEPLAEVKAPQSSLLALATAALCVGIAIIRDGEYVWPVMVPLTIAIGATLWSIFKPTGKPLTEKAIAALIVILGVQFFLLLISPPSGWNWWSDDLKPATPSGAQRFYYGILLAAACAILPLVWKPARVPCTLVLLLTHLALSVWIIQACPNPDIDVFDFQQQGVNALLERRNPYTLTFPVIYDEAESAKAYGPGMLADGKTTFGTPYPPVSVLMNLPGYKFWGDYRYSAAIAMTLASALLTLARRDVLGLIAAALLLFTPRGFFILGRGWSEPFVVLLLAVVVFCAVKNWWRWGVPIALGLFLASKQYLILALPLILLLPVKEKRGLFFKTLTVAILTLIPFFLWSPSGFIQSLVTVQLKAPFRNDAVSYLVLIHRTTGIQPSAVFGFLAAGAGIGISLWKLPRSIFGFAIGLSLTLLLFFAFNKQAFANYYYLVIGSLCCGIAAMPQPGISVKESNTIVR